MSVLAQSDAGGVDRGGAIGSGAEGSAVGDSATVWDRPMGDGGAVAAGSEGLVVDGDSAGEVVQGRPGELLAGVLMLAGVSLMVFVVMNWTRRRMRVRRSRPDAAPDERLAEIRARAARVDPIAAAAVESEQVARRFAAMLDNKSRRLELLLDDTDARIARLERLLDLASERGVPEDGLVGRVDDGRTGGGGEGVGFVGAMGGVQRDQDDDQDEDGGVDPLTRDVYALADAGLPASEIARRLEQHTGKVELILALRSA